LDLRSIKPTPRSERRVLRREGGEIMKGKKGGGTEGAGEEANQNDT
jgi:hypothetical protein